jgi:hypothetical protein
LSNDAPSLPNFRRFTPYEISPVKNPEGSRYCEGVKNVINSTSNPEIAYKLHAL